MRYPFIGLCLCLLAPSSAAASPNNAAAFDSITSRVTELRRSADYAGAAASAAYLSELLGEDATDWRGIQARKHATLLREIAALPAAAQAELAEADRLLPLIIESLDNQTYDRGEPIAARQLELRSRYFRPEQLLIAECLCYSSFFLLENGKLESAEIYARRALEIQKRELGPDNPVLDECLTSLNNLAVKYLRRDNLAVAARLLREVLAARKHLLGEEHNRVAGSTNNLAVVYRNQGRDAELEPLLRVALATQRRLLGDAHRKTSIPMTNLGEHLCKTGRHEEGEALLREALGHLAAQYGEESVSVANVKSSLANAYDDRGDDELAESYYRQSLATLEKALGRGHLDTGAILYEFAAFLMKQGRLEEAERALIDLLGRLIDSSGEQSLYSVQSLVMLGECRLSGGDPAAAMRYLERAAAIFESARLRAGGGFARATFRDSPYSLLAATRLEAGVPETAWPATERALGRALADLLISSGRRPLDANEAAREDSLKRRLAQFESQIAAYRTADPEEKDPGGAEPLRQARLRLLDTEVAWDEFQQAISAKYPVAEGQAFDLARVQTALDEKTALLGWLSVKHRQEEDRVWAYVIRSAGPVRWIPLDKKDNGADIGAAIVGARELRDAIHMAASWRTRVGDTTEIDRRALALWAAIGSPVEAHLAGARNLVIVHSRLVQGLPVEALIDGEGRFIGDRFAVSYVSSATVHTWLREQERGPAGEARSSALLLADPPFAPEQLLAMESGDPVDLDGDEWALLTRETTVFRDALAGDTQALARLPRIPWTRREVEALAPLFERARVLLGPEASEEALFRLAESGELRNFTTIHLATHALVDVELPRRSALVLSRVGLPDPLAAAMRGERVFDGLLRAGEIIREWDLNADLVTLSACKTGLGRDIEGEGYIGLANAFLQAGARCVLVSLWRVEDEATSLLMGRFYKNLTSGAEDGMSKARALAEAKRWLRGHVDSEGNRPFEHPVYWSGFILIGDSN